MERVKKPRKQLSEESLQKLALARAKANQIRGEKTLIKLESKVSEIKSKRAVKPIVTDDEEDASIEAADIEERTVEAQPVTEEAEVEAEVEAEEEVKKPIKEKKKPVKKKPVVIVEQSSDDDDEFEANEKVIFVKRTTRKKKESVVEMPIVPELLAPPPPLKKQISQQQIMLNQTYNNMNNGVFAPTNRRR